MSRRSARLDFSIRGDEQEHQRMLLEHNLQHTDLSLHLSSTPDDYSDVEYPRHAPSHSPQYSAYASFDHRSGDDFDPHEASRFHAWSYHTEDGVQSYAGGESLSTAAHHASALTISAGLGGGRGQRRDVSMSGAEYDPERPLQGIMAGIAGRFNGFDANSTKSRQITASVADFDPLIVEDTAELDRVLQSGRALPATIRSARSSSPSTSSDSTGPLSPPPQQDSRPRLADALSHMTFSPKRPRNAQGLPSPRMANASLRNASHDRSVARHLPRSSSPPDPVPASTPRPQRRINQSLSYAQNSVSHSRIEPEVNILPATPSVKRSQRERDESSKFTNMARGLAREIEAEAEADAAMKRHVRQSAPDATPKAYHHNTIAAKPKGYRSPFREKLNGRPDKMTHAATPFKKSVQLPDVTGLTSAIASPAKVDVEFYGYDPKDTTEAEARLIATLSVVQNKLAFLEQENSVSRRRVRELEIELEACKQKVARERTQIMEQSVVRDEESTPGRRVVNQRIQQQKKKAEEEKAELTAAAERYEQAVEEKKELERMINHLRTQLTRLTAELSELKQLLLELHSFRNSDVRALAEKSQEVNALKTEVERLAGEVHQLRGVVEERLQARCHSREHREIHEADRNAGSAQDCGEEEESEEKSQQAQQQAHPQDQKLTRARAPSVHSEVSDEDSEDESISRRSPTPSPGRRLVAGTADKTMRTDYATVASSQGPSLNANVSRPFLNSEEISQITQEVEERRSERSIQSRSQDDSQSQAGSASQEHSRSWSREPQPNQSRRVSRVASPSIMPEDEPSTPKVPTAQLEYSVRFANEPSQAESSRPSSPHLKSGHAQVSTVAPVRPAAPTPAAASRNAASQKRRAHTAPQPEFDAPFPQIRGAHLERLFFSAPEHNRETCATCHRKKRRQADEVERAESWLRDRERNRANGRQYENEEGVVEGAEDVRHHQSRRAYPAKSARDREDERLPPQTVLVQVLRELEDDFSHWKSIYIEYADQYKDMDPVSNVAKRNVLADHLHEVIDILERTGNQIASLYDLLTFKDKPISESAVPPATRSAPSTFGPSQGRAFHRYPTT